MGRSGFIAYVLRKWRMPLPCGTYFPYMVAIIWSDSRCLRGDPIFRRAGRAHYQHLTTNRYPAYPIKLHHRVQMALRFGTKGRGGTVGPATRTRLLRVKLLSGDNKEEACQTLRVSLSNFSIMNTKTSRMMSRGMDLCRS